LPAEALAKAGFRFQVQGLGKGSPPGRACHAKAGGWGWVF